MRKNAITVILLIALSFTLTDVYAGPKQPEPPIIVTATSQTGLYHTQGDEVSEACFWIHPRYPYQSLIVGNDPQGGLICWDLTGKEVKLYSSKSKINTLDIRYNFKYGNRVIALIGGVNQNEKCLEFYTIHPFTQEIEALKGRIELAQENPYGGCFYHSPLSDKYFYFVSWKNGLVQQWELNGASGVITAKLVREFKVGSTVRGCVADDGLARFYINEADIGLWRYGAEPGDGARRYAVDSTNPVSGHATPNLTGLTLYYASGIENIEPEGYLISISQGSDTYQVYDRISNYYLGSFQIGATPSISAVKSSISCEVINLNLGVSWPTGVFLTHNRDTTTSNISSNFKMVSWNDITQALGLKIIPNVWNPTKGKNNKPNIVAIADKTVRGGQNLIFNIKAIDTESNAIEYSVLNLPAGASFDPFGRSFSWTPSISQAGRYRVTFMATDGYAIDAEEVKIIVTKPQSK